MKREGLFSLGSTHAERSASFWLFLIGLGTTTQISVGGYTAISEFFIVALLPITLVRNWRVFAQDRCMTILYLLLLWIGGVCLTDFLVDNYFWAFIRGLIPAVGTFAALITIYPLLKRNPDALKWFLLGLAISGVVSIFVFQPGTTLGSHNVRSGAMSASEARMSYKLFWVNQLNTWLGLPIEGWYMALPNCISVIIGVFLAMFSLVTGGRSAFLVSFLSTVIIFLCGHSRERMRAIGRHTMFIIVGLALLAPIVKLIYKEAATRGIMGDYEADRYEEQAKGASIIETLMRGRGEVFIAVLAALDKPFLGHGSMARDTKGYVLNYVVKYGNDYETIKQVMDNERAYGVRLIPAHSHIICYWMWAGIPGLLPWLYILYLLSKTLFKRVAIYPPYFGYFAFMVPFMWWHIFFSPFGSRITMGFLIAACLVVQTMEQHQKRMRIVVA